MFPGSLQRFKFPIDADENDDENFSFETSNRYNPKNQNGPILSPSVPHFGKFSKNLPSHFKLPKISERLFESNSYDLRSKKKEKKRHKSQNFDSSSFSLSSKSRQYSNDDTDISNNHITIQLDGLSMKKIVSNIKKEFKKLSPRDEKVVFTLKGAERWTYINPMKKEINTLATQFGYSLNSNASSGVIIQCDRADTDEVFEDTNDTAIHKTTMLVPTSSEECIMNIIRKRLASVFNGIVTFKPINGKYPQSLRGTIIVKIIDLCKEFGYSARVVDYGAQIIECDMRTQHLTKPASNEQTNNEMQPQNIGCFKVDVPWDSPGKAEVLIRSYLTNSSYDRIRFTPNVGMYSVTKMKNFPDKIEQICTNEFHYQAIKLPGEIVDCIKESAIPRSFSAPSIGMKVVQLPTNDRRLMEQMVRNQLECGKIGNVVLNLGVIRQTSIICEKVCEICKEYGFQYNVSKNSSNELIVQITMTKKICNQIAIPLPINNISMLKQKVKRYIESCFIGKIDFTPESKIDRTSFKLFAKSITDIVDSYAFQSQVIEGPQIIRCMVNPQFFNLSSFSDDSQIESKVKNVLTSASKNSFVVFSIQKKSVPEMQRASEKVAKICKNIGYLAKVSEFYYQCVVCYTSGTKISDEIEMPPLRRRRATLSGSTIGLSKKNSFKI